MRRAPLILAALSLAGVAACSGDSPERVGEVGEAFTSVCPPTVVEGIDVYDGQGTIDWTQVAGSGRKFAFIKATQGDYNTQARFPANWSASKTAGILRAPYHFFDPTIDGVAQAKHFLQVLDGAGGLLDGDLPPVLDIECPTSASQASASPNCEHTGDSGWVATATLITRVFDWLATVEQATGRKAILYSFPSWFGDVGLTDARLTQYPLYIATLSTCASVPLPWTTTAFWQYSFTGKVPGITGQVDLDRFVGTEADLVALATAPAVADAGVDAPADAAPIDDGSAPDAADAAEAAVQVTGSAAGGCSCREAGGGASSTPWALAIAGWLVVRRRRRAARRVTSAAAT